MGNLFLMTTITDRKAADKYFSLFQENGLHVIFGTLGYGTATNDVLDYLGLEKNEKAVTPL